MSVASAGVTTVIAAHEAFNARDVDGLVAVAHPACEWLPFRAQLSGAPYRGHEGVRSFVRDMDEDWSSFRIDPVELTEHGELVIVSGRVTGTGRGSGVDVDFVGGFVFELRDGLIHGLRSYDDPESARSAAGIGG